MTIRPKAIRGALLAGCAALLSAADAVAREWREEYGLTLEGPRLLGVLENLFTHEGVPGHEIVFAFEARVAEPYTRDEIESMDAGGRRHEAVWVPVAALAAGGISLSPAGLLDLIHPTG